MKMLIMWIPVALLFGLGGCRPNEEERMNDTQLVAIAQKYIREHRPEWPQESLNMPAKVTDFKDYWEVTFELPKDTVGGVPVLHIDKHSHNVIKAYHTQ